MSSGVTCASGLAGCLLPDVDDGKRHDKVFDRDLSHALAVRREMQRSVHVGSGVLVDHPLVQIELVVLVGELRHDLELRITKIGWEVRVELVGQIPDAAGGDRHGRGLRLCGRRYASDRRRGCRSGCASEEAATIEHPLLHLVDHAMLAHDGGSLLKAALQASLELKLNLWAFRLSTSTLLANQMRWSRLQPCMEVPHGYG